MNKDSKDKEVPGICYGVWYSNTDPMCRKCIAKSRCRSSVLRKMKNDLDTNDVSINSFLYLIGLLDKSIGEYEVVRGDFSVLYRFVKNGKFVCVLIISKFTKRIKIITRGMNDVKEEIRTKKEADKTFSTIINNI